MLCIAVYLGVLLCIATAVFGAVAVPVACRWVLLMADSSCTRWARVGGLVALQLGYLVADAGDAESYRRDP